MDTTYDAVREHVHAIIEILVEHDGDFQVRNKLWLKYGELLTETREGLGLLRNRQRSEDGMYV